MAASSESLRDALGVLGTRGVVSAARAGLAWTGEDSALCGACALTLSRGAGDGPAVVGLVGGASSGKSTLMNNLVGASVSAVGMRAHTTVGPVMAVGASSEESVRSWVARHGMLGVGELVRSDESGRAGSVECVTLTVSGDDGVLRNALLVDTPDFTSIAARDAGDLTRRMLAWFDRVLVLIDEDRWYDEQVFGWLRSRLDALGSDRMVVFNRCQRGGTGSVLSELEIERLGERAALLDAEHVIVDHSPGRGEVTLDASSLGAISSWAGRPISAESLRTRGDRLLGQARALSSALLEAASAREVLFERLSGAMRQECRSLALNDRQIAMEVLLSAEQRRELDPVWQSVVRPVAWVGEMSRAAARVMPFGRVPAEARSEIDESTISGRGRAFFEAEASRLSSRLLACARSSELWAAGGLDDGGVLGETFLEEARAEGAALGGACDRAFEAFRVRFEAEAKGLKIGALSSGAAVVGATIGAVLTAPAGGLTAPIGALIGAGIGASASAAGGRSVWRLGRLLLKTPELRELWASVGAYRAGLERFAELARERLDERSAMALLGQADPVRHAAEVVAGSESR